MLQYSNFVTSMRHIIIIIVLLFQPSRIELKLELKLRLEVELKLEWGDWEWDWQCVFAVAACGQCGTHMPRWQTMRRVAH